jgi:phosphoribosylformylglycinamidine synthase
VALTFNDCGNFRDDWVHLTANDCSPCVFTRGIESIELPVRHGEGKFYAADTVVKRLLKENQVALRYALADGLPAAGRYPFNPNGSVEDIAGICDPTGRLFGLMPHPEAFHHPTNHPDWTRHRELERRGVLRAARTTGVRIFENAVAYFN